MVLMRNNSNWWQPQDERFKGLLDIANAINDAHDLAFGDADLVWQSEMNPSVYPMWAPRRLAKRMREAADHIEGRTEV